MIFNDAFISYGQAASKAFASHLQQRLAARGYRVWFDQTDSPRDALNDDQIPIAQNIEQAHNFLVLISPDAVHSPACILEIEQALKYHKRIIPLLHGEAMDQTDLHPALASINSISMREGLDDFDLALNQLCQTLDDQPDYVQRHTQYLTAALTWQRNQRQPQFLLTGDRCQPALDWLQQAFEADPACCRPTDWHCEWITESVKYADHQMAQVYLSYADAPESDSNLDTLTWGNRVRQVLMRAGLTVWDRHYDLGPGDTLEVAIDRGVEAADNLVFLLTPGALQSSPCLQELSYALSMNKRVVPVLIATVNPEQIPQVLQDMHWIDLRGWRGVPAIPAGLQQLIKTLQTDAPYYRTHKLLLVQALKWERQRRNPSILQRGERLQADQTWLTMAEQRQRHQPLRLHRAFIEASLAQPPAQTLDVFLIYDPVDLDFARKLNDTLQRQGKSTWFHPPQIMAAGDLAGEMEQALTNAENGLFLLSAAAIRNPHCLAQLALARSLHKRMVAVAYQPMATEDLPAGFTDLPRIDFCHQPEDFAAKVDRLVQILESDPNHVGLHTRLLVRATTWDKTDRDDGLLLRNTALKQAQTWLGEAQGKTPTPTQLHRAYITASQQLPRRRIRRRSLGLCSIAATLMVVVLRLGGELQPLELATYDGLLRHRPSEPPDPRLLIVMVDDSSSAWLREQITQGHYQPGIGSISDQTLAVAIDQLQTHHPALIGLDLRPDFAASPRLQSRLTLTPNLVGLCEGINQEVGVKQPPGVPLPRVGFNDVRVDTAPRWQGHRPGVKDGGGYGKTFIRRHYLKQKADPEFCPTEDAFSLVIARTYLAQQGVSYTDPWQQPDHPTAMRLGRVVVPQLWANGVLFSHSSAYTPLYPAQFNGYQTMVNFRADNGDLQQFAPQVSLKQLLTNQVDPALIRGRIVLIGYNDVTNPSANFYDTAYGQVPGVVLQGQLISQLISAPLDGRPLLWWWPTWGELLWIWGWSLGAGLVVWGLVRPVQMAVGLTGLGLGLGAGCYLVLVGWGGWIPLVPAALAMVWDAGLVAFLTYRVRHPCTG